MRIVLASGNPHKAEELAAILAPHQLLLPQDLGLRFACDETGSTFAENALQKARALLALRGKADFLVLADDSGLCVDALGGAPGIHSARFGAGLLERPLTSDEQCCLLMEQLQGVEDRRARFVCAMVLLFDANRFCLAQETLEGEIATFQVGQNGFGYDPVFFLPGRDCTLAQLPANEKNSISHRGRAAGRLRSLIEAESRT